MAQLSGTDASTRARRLLTSADARRYGTGLSAAALIVAVGADQGGWRAESWRSTTLALSCVSAAVLLLKEHVSVSRHEVVALCSLAALGGWMLLSRAWSGEPDLAAREAERCGLYLSALLLVIAVVDREQSQWLLGGLLAGITVLSAWALIDFARGVKDNGLLVGPVWYSNGAGVLAAMGSLLGVAAASRMSGSVTRLLWIAPIAVLAPALALTQSRGAMAALAVVGVLAYVRPFKLAGALLAAGALALTLIWTFASSALPSSFTDNPRWSYWDASLHDYLAHPLLGSGAGTYWLYWAAHPRPVLDALDGHSLYLESLAELGPVGLALIVLVLAAVVGASRRYATGSVTSEALVFAVYAVHAAVDWDWELPVVTLSALLAAGAVLVQSKRSTRELVSGPYARYALLGLSLALAGVSLVRLQLV